MGNFVQNVFDLIKHLSWQNFYIAGLKFLHIAYYVFVVLIFLFIILHIFVLIKFWKMRPLLHPRLGEIIKNSKVVKEKKEKWEGEWLEIKKTLLTSEPQSFKGIVSLADKFVDKVLKELGIAGEHLADKLEKLSLFELSSVFDLTKAHRIATEISQMPDVVLTKEEIEELLKAYESFLKEINVLT